MMSKNSLERIHKTGKVGSMFMKILQIILFFFLVVNIGLLFYTKFLPKNTFMIQLSQQMQTMINSPGLQSGTEYYSVQINSQNGWIILIPLCLELAAMVYTLSPMRRLFEQLEICKTPFEDKVRKQIRKIGFIFLIWIFLPVLCRNIYRYAVDSANFHLDLFPDLMPIFFVFVCYLLNLIWKYGKENS